MPLILILHLLSYDPSPSSYLPLTLVLHLTSLWPLTFLTYDPDPSPSPITLTLILIPPTL